MPNTIGTGPTTIELSCRPGPLTRRSGLTLFPCTNKMPMASQDVWVWISVADQKRGFEGVLWYQDQFPANHGFLAQAGCQRRRRRTQAGYGHPEATLKPPSGHLVANR